MPLPITAIYAGLLTLWVILLAFAVVRLRVARQVSLLDGGHRDLLRAIRAHGNATETIPLTLLLLALAEGLGAPAAVLHGLGLAFLAARVLHGLNFAGSNELSMLRLVGMALTILIQAVLALGLVAHGLFGGAGS